MGFFALVRYIKRYILQYVLGHRLVVARPDGVEVTAVSSTAEFEEALDEVLGTYVNTQVC